MARSSLGAEPFAPRLYLLTPDVGAPAMADGRAFAASLDAVLEAGDVAAVLLRSGRAETELIRRHLETMAPVIDRRGTALLIEDAPDLAIAAGAGADGVHVSDPGGLKRALAALKPDRIVGAGGLKTRHDAMVAGEAGADYVMFGESDAAGRRPSLEALLERVAWWAELFEVPCVGFASDLDEVSRLVKAGADFIAASDLVWNNAAGPVGGGRALAALLGAKETA
jgi:thiamine-phosphate pyrophosphorylase